MLKSFQNYVVENPNAFQIVSTLAIGIVAFAIWKFIFQAPKGNG